MSDLSYDVIALEFPIVYTLDGDVDVNGLLYTLRAYQPLLEFAQEQWERDKSLLPKLHERRQMIQLVVDGLGRYEQMRARLLSGPREDRHLLHYGVADRDEAPLDPQADPFEEPTVGPPLEAGADEPPDDCGPGCDDGCDEGSSPRAKTVRQNLHATVDELLAALDRLTGGEVDRLSPDRVTRLAWAAFWRAGLVTVETAISGRLVQADAGFDAALPALVAASGLTPQRIRRLLFNDHRRAHVGPAPSTPPYDRFNPLRPIPLVRPLVLRAALGQNVEVRFENLIRGRKVGIHMQGEGIGGVFGPQSTTPNLAGDGVQFGDGADVGRNRATTVGYQRQHTYHWHAGHEGVWPFNDLGDVRGTQLGTNVHGLFGAFVVEPAGSTWSDPETGDPLTGTNHADGPDVDVHPPGEVHGTKEHLDFTDFRDSATVPRSYREFTVFIHDEPELHSGQHLVGEHTVMPLSYRAEPMPHRLPHRMRRYAQATSPLPPAGQVGVDQTAVRIVIDENLSEVFEVARTPDGRFLERVAGEEQHHSSWLFGDPITPIFRAYAGDPARVRLVHAGVKETHVFHLHVHQWYAVAQDGSSQELDSITIGPQTGLTIDPLYGSGSRQHLFGDVIWHCHLYPHFHHGMWGLWRSFDRRVRGTGPVSAYPDGTPVHPLVPLAGREPPEPDAEHPGFPWFIDAGFPQKSPPPPAVIAAHRTGRRRLLGLPLHSTLERNAFPPGVLARPSSGAVFVDLDGYARSWNDAAGLPPPRIISYDVEVRSDPAEYNSQGWHDRQGHHYQITAVEVRQLNAQGDVDLSTTFPPPQTRLEPFFPRANRGDIVEWRMHNRLASIPADDFDLPTPPVECGLHVHLVKFDVLTADGSSTGFNYLSGASTAEAVGPDVAGEMPSNVGLHRWVVDQEFGPCFFHDHLLANYRQKHGLYAALIAEPFGSQWTLPDQETTAWSGPQAVVVPPENSGLPPYREACLGVADFVPLYGRDGKPLNPPGELSGDDDPGSMAVNYRSTPLTYRGPDPSLWFSSSSRQRESDTEMIQTYPGERLRIRLIQGSHEEQHSFMIHGMRWHQEWHNPASRLVNQQTIGISEAFTLDIDPAGSSPYGPGDHLWLLAAMDDLWLGCWGLVRALPPGPETFAELPPLPSLVLPPAAPPATLLRAVPDRPVEPDRTYIVTARRREHRYADRTLTDPWGLIYELADSYRDELIGDGTERTWRRAEGIHITGEPLVLRARRGEWVRVTLINEVIPGEQEHEDNPDPRRQEFGVEPNPPPLPLEHRDELGHPDRRTVSTRVSLHPSLLQFDVVGDDGSYVGHNHDGTVASVPDPESDEHGHDAGTVLFRHTHSSPHQEENWREYWWYADDALAPADHAKGPGQVCYLQDMADVRNHRHHGLIGALVVEPGNATPDAWSGTHTLIRDTTSGHVVANEQVLLWQDGLRHFVAGNPDLPVRDVVPDDDPEDAGQKGINYRCAMVHPATALNTAQPGTPIWPATVGDQLWLHLLGASDKPRNHTFTVHGMAWEAAPWVPGGPMLGSLSGLSAGVAHTLKLKALHPGDHAYRSGVFRWAVENGMWGILRVT